MKWLLNPKISSVVMFVLYVLQAVAQFYIGNWRIGVYWLLASGMPLLLAF